MKPISPENYIIRPFKTYKRHEYSLDFLQNTSEEFSVYQAVRPEEGWEWSGDPGDLNHDSIIFKNHLYKSIIQVFYQDTTRVPLNFDRGFDPRQEEEFYVVSISQQAFGEKIKKGSFSFGTSESSNRIVDDGEGHLVIKGEEEGAVLGNIFYELGIAVIKKQPENETQ